MYQFVTVEIGIAANTYTSGSVFKLQKIAGGLNFSTVGNGPKL